jgi:hypothetical protein
MLSSFFVDVFSRSSAVVAYCMAQFQPSPQVNAKLKRTVRFQVLTAARMTMTVFWDVAPFSLVEVYLT